MPTTRALCKAPAKDCAELCASCEESAAAEIAELRADLEWSARQCAVYSQGRLRWTRDIGGIECAGTPEDLRRVIRQARKGE